MSESTPEIQPTPDPGQPDVSTGDLQPDDPAVQAASSFELLDEPPAEDVRSADDVEAVEPIEEGDLEPDVEPEIVTDAELEEPSSELSTDNPETLGETDPAPEAPAADVSVPDDTSTVYDPTLDSQVHGEENETDLDDEPGPDPLPESSSVPADTEPEIDEDTAKREGDRTGTSFAAPNGPVEEALEGAQADVVPDDSKAQELADEEDASGETPAEERTETQAEIAKRINPKLRRLRKYQTDETNETNGDGDDDDSAQG